jgi:hypothetical protein
MDQTGHAVTRNITYTGGPVRQAPLIVLTVVSCLLTTPAASQERHWGLSGEFGLATFGGHAQSRDGATPDDVSGHPSSSSTFGLRVDRSGRSTRVSLGLLRASMGVAFEDDESLVESKDVLTLLEITPEIALSVVKSGESVLRVHLGAVIDRWSPDGAEARTTIGGLGGTSLEMPFTPRIAVYLRYEVSVGRSLFEEGDLPAELERTSGVRQRWAVGGRYGL